MKKKNRIVIFVNICLLLITTIYCGIMVNNNTTNSTVFASDTSKAMCVIEKNSKRILLSKNENQKLANASTTKIVTFFTVLKNCANFDEKVKIDDRAIGIRGTSIYLKKGECLTVKELLYGMMLVSGNDAATALALHISNSIDDFAVLMTKEAHKIGAKNSNFKNPHGLDEDGHYTTAYDLALITSECYKYPIFEEIVTTKNTRISNTDNGYRYLKNKNKLLWTLEGANGVKTGFTNNAGRCLVSSAKRDNMQLICVVLNCGPMFEESAIHLNDCFLKYKMVKLLSEYSYIKNVPVENSKCLDVKVFTKHSFCYPLTLEEEQLIKTEIDLPNTLVAPLKKEQIVGELKIYLDKHLLFCEKIYTMEEIKSNRIGDIIKSIISKW